MRVFRSTEPTMSVNSRTISREGDRRFASVFGTTTLIADLSLVQRLILPRAGSLVQTAGANKAVRVMLFDDMRTPTAGARAREDGSVQIRRNSEHVKHWRRIKIGVGIQAYLRLHRASERFAHPQ